ncbi:MAG TPA: hypothetical protein ENK18_22070 [Deltaproteobacteria bacterium]|nr:hypothetical protein [Deltaproteobacteria bacterium]
MIVAVLTLTGLAAAGGWSAPKPYAQPILDLNVAAVNGETFMQGTAGLAAGARSRHSGKAHVLSHTRGQAVGMVGIPSGSLGVDLRAGSFIGPDPRFIRYQIGPDIWFNGYGTNESRDYWLPYSPGIDLSNELTLKFAREFQIIGEATPGWAFVPERQQGGVGPFHELTLTAMAVLRTPVLSLNVGYTRRYLTFGVYEGLILSMAI